MIDILQALFFVAWSVGVVSWFVGIIEALGMWRFWPWAYRNGPKVLDESAPSLPASLHAGAAIDLPLVKGQVKSHQEVFFRFPLQWFGIHTPFPIKGALTFEGGAARVVGRVPIGTVVFFAAWVVGWTSGALMAFSSIGLVEASLFLLLGWAFAAVLVAISLPLELRRIRRARDELVRYLGSAAA